MKAKHIRPYLTIESVKITGSMLGGVAVLLVPHLGPPFAAILSKSQAEQLKSALPPEAKP